MYWGAHESLEGQSALGMLNPWVSILLGLDSVTVMALLHPMSLKLHTQNY